MKTGFKKYLKIIYNCILAMSVLFFVALPWKAAAQSGTALHGSNPIDEELSGTVVNCMLQDSSGFLWFGTQMGLYRYNGYSLKPYTFSSDLSDNFVSNFITSLCEDNSKNIWVGTFGGGLFKLDPQSGEYRNFDESEEGGLSENIIRAICPDDSGKLWIGTQNKGLDCLDPVSGEFEHYESTANDEASISSNAISSICRDKTGALWIGTYGGGLNKFDGQSGRFLRFKKQAGDSDSIADNDISRLYTDKAGILWIVTGSGGLDRLDTASGRFIDGDFPETEDLKITAVYEDNSGALWAGTYGKGVRRLDKDSGSFMAYGCDFYQNAALCNSRVVSLFGDSSGNLWIGTEGSGTDKINTNLNFMSYKNNTTSGISFSDDVILSLYKDGGGIVWIGTANGGMNKFDRESGSVTVYKNDPGDDGSISSNSISSIYKDSRGIMWFGTIDGTLNKYDPASGRFTHYPTKGIENPMGADNGILGMYEDEGDMLWACTANGGLVRLDKSTGRLAQFTRDPEKPYSISSNHVLSIAADSSGVLWIGTGGGGLNRLETTSGQFTRYGVSEPDSAVTTQNYNVYAIANDHNLLWLATDIGLFRFDKASGSAAFIKDSRQPANTRISGLLKDEGDNLWLSTSRGLMKYNIPSGTFKKYDFDEGLQRNQYVPGAYFKSGDGEMFFGGTNGFSCFYPEKIRDNTYKPPVVITDFKIFDTSVGLADAGKVTLSYKDNFISFEFAALDFANPAKNQYAYKLEGFDAQWHYTGTRNYASYTNLGDGEYVLRIKASNNDGLWNEEGTEIRLVIRPPFWKTAWFTMIAFLFVCGSIIALVKIRTRSIKLKNLELERLAAERTMELDRANEQLRRADELKRDFLSTVSHEIRTPLSAMLGFTELIAAKIEKSILPGIDLKDQKVRKAAEKISRDLNIIISEGDRLTSLVDNLLNISKIESGKMDWKIEVLDIHGLIEQALSITRPIIGKAGLEVHTEIEAGLPEVPGDRDGLTQVLINLISNSVKFTDEGHIKVCAKNSQEGILVWVEDTGIGIAETHLSRVFERFYKAGSPGLKDRSDSSAGLGLYICRQIVEKHGGRIWVESRPGKGSTFYFTLPF